jgi:hypothetical protein
VASCAKYAISYPPDMLISSLAQTHYHNSIPYLQIPTTWAQLMAKKQCPKRISPIVVSVSLSPPPPPLTRKSPGLFAVMTRQALFIAPCSHAFHYECIRSLLEGHPSAFSCPLCRTFADLDEGVEAPSSPEDNDCDELR